MTTPFAQAFIAGTVVGVVLILLWWAIRLGVVWQESRQPLTPNCLLTKKPILLIGPKEPHWKFWSHRQRAQRFLARHGYEAALDHLDQASKPHCLDVRELSQTKPFEDLLKSAVRFAEQDFI